MVRGIATALALMTVVVTQAVAPARADDARMEVTLVGTGGPEYFPDRLGISTLVEANGEMLLFDVGRGANQRLYQSRVNPKDISKIFLTHLHNDHFEGLPDLWMTPWFLLGRDHGFELWGPEGTAEMVQGMRAMFRHDLKARVNQFNPIETLAIQPHIVAEGQIIARTRAAGYDGPLVMGLDRMVLEITGDVKVVPPRSLDDLPNLDSKGQKFP